MQLFPAVDPDISALAAALILTAAALPHVLTRESGWHRRPASPRAAAWTCICVAAAGLIVATARGVASPQPAAILDIACILSACATGGPVTASILRRASPRDLATQAAAAHLPGGALLGVLERLIVCVCLLGGWPAGIATFLAVKGVGRFPALTEEGTSSVVAERFLLGTCTSVLWAAAHAGVAACVS